MRWLPLFLVRSVVDSHSAIICNNLIIYYAVLFGGKAVIVDPKSGAKRSYLKRVGTALH